MNWIESLLGTARSRLSNPLAGSFILSWTVINWKIALILLSAEVPNAEKINLLTEADYFNGWNLFLWPLVFGILLTVAIPLTTWLLETALNPIQVRRLKQRIDVTKVTAELEKLDEEWGTYEALKSNFENTQNENDFLSKELKVAKKKITNLSDELKSIKSFQRSYTDDASPQNEKLSLEETLKYEEWKREALRIVRDFMNQEVSNESFEFADELFSQLRDSDPRSLLDLKAKIRDRADYTKSTDFSQELVRLADILPSHPDEIPF